jgi:ATP-dependent exoDNAse (exonuclease V) beta subunit
VDPSAEAEVRLFYVAMTRAKKQLVVEPELLETFTGGGWKMKQPEPKRRPEPRFIRTVRPSAPSPAVQRPITAPVQRPVAIATPREAPRVQRPVTAPREAPAVRPQLQPPPVRIELQTPVKPTVVKATVQPPSLKPASPPPLPPVATQTSKTEPKSKSWWKFWE